MILSKREQHLANLQHYNLEYKEVVAYLLAHSNLPGKRANLELAFAFSDNIEEHYPVNPELALTFCEALINENPTDKHVTGSEEFLPFCGVVGFGRIGKIDPLRESGVLVYIKSAAQDERWRIREAVAIAIQDLMDVRPEATVVILQSWVQDGNYLLYRAVAAGIAEPRLMNKIEIARDALELHKAILDKVARVADRRDPNYIILVKGLCYTLSVVITGIEKEGFTYLEDLLATGHPVIQKIVRENLKKERLFRLNAEIVANHQQKLVRTV